MKKTAIKLISALLSVALVFSLSFSVAADTISEDGEYVYDETRLGNIGDANRDNKVSVADAKTILRAVSNLTELDEVQIYNADVNKDGEITLADAKQILKVCADLDVFRVNVILEPGEEYVIDSVYDRGAYFWTCNVPIQDSLYRGLDCKIDVIEFPDKEYVGTPNEFIYTFSSMESGATYTVDFKLAHVGNSNDVLTEIIYTFYIK